MDIVRGEECYRLVIRNDFLDRNALALDENLYRFARRRSRNLLVSPITIVK
jgi:hypothetical protein